MSTRAARCAAGILAGALLQACSTPVGPDYHRPPAVLAEHWSDAGWSAAAPADGEARGPWWTVYGDRRLDELEAGATTDSPTLQAALAALAGQPAPDFQLEPAALPDQVPHPALGLPADLLQRRPDIASAERAVAQANAQIGVATAARYPSLALTGNAGTDSRALSSLLNAPSALWSFGASLAATVYDSGRITATIEAARAAHEAAVANYRDTVLGAMSEVEGALRAEQVLAQATRRQEIALATAREQLVLLTRRHDAGFGTAPDLLAAEQAVRLEDRELVQLRGQRLLNSVYLVRALGGGWDAAAAPGSPAGVAAAH